MGFRVRQRPGNLTVPSSNAHSCRSGWWSSRVNEHNDGPGVAELHHYLLDVARTSYPEGEGVKKPLPAKVGFGSEEGSGEMSSLSNVYLAFTSWAMWSALKHTKFWNFNFLKKY